jgi:hypothetical protein
VAGSVDSHSITIASSLNITSLFSLTAAPIPAHSDLLGRLVDHHTTFVILISRRNEAAENGVEESNGVEEDSDEAASAEEAKPVDEAETIDEASPSDSADLNAEAIPVPDSSPSPSLQEPNLRRGARRNRLPQGIRRIVQPLQRAASGRSAPTHDRGAERAAREAHANGEVSVGGVPGVNEAERGDEGRRGSV